MVPRDQFNRMAALALAAILLLLTFACRAYAAEITFRDSGPVPEQGESDSSEGLPWYIIPDYGEWKDSGNLLEFDPPDRGEEETLSSDVTAIRQMLEMVLYFIIPFICAVILVYKFCIWFYYTFIRTVL